MSPGRASHALVEPRSHGAEPPPGDVWFQDEASGHALEFARVVAEPGGKALLIDDQNDGDGWVLLPVAIASGKAYAVAPRRNLVVVDADNPEDADEVVELAEETFWRHWIPAVVVASGHEGHRHVFGIAETAEKAMACAVEFRKSAILKGLTFDLRSPRAPGRSPVGGCIRPPLSPHRLGGRSTLLSPAAPHEALERLRWADNGAKGTAPVEELSRPPAAQFSVVAATSPELSSRRLLSVSMAVLLATGTQPGRTYASASEVVQAIALGAANAGWSFHDFEVALSNPVNLGGATYRTRIEKRGLGRAKEWLERSWRRALEFQAVSPPRRVVAPSVERAISEIETALQLVGWVGMAGHTDKAVLLAVIALGRAQGTICPHAASRTVADLARVSRTTATRSLWRCVGRGWFEPPDERATHPRHAHRWRLRLPEGHDRTSADSSNAVAGSDAKLEVGGPHTRPQHGEERGPHATGFVLPDNDAWRWKRGLGLAVRSVWEALSTTPQTAKEISALVGRRHPRTVRDHLRRLAREGLATKVGKRGQAFEWVRTPGANLDAFALRSGATAAGNRQRRKHREEQAEWANRWSEDGTGEAAECSAAHRAVSRKAVQEAARKRAGMRPAKPPNPARLDRPRTRPARLKGDALAEAGGEGGQGGEPKDGTTG